MVAVVFLCLSKCPSIHDKACFQFKVKKKSKPFSVIYPNKTKILLLNTIYNDINI